MSEIQKTNDYSIFKKHLSNRELDPGNLKKITASIRARNLLAFRPILVDSEMRVIDGQHRLMVAKILGLEIFYQVQQECTHEDIVLLNQHQKGWKIEDYIDYFISLGNQNYLALKKLKQLSGCTYNAIVRMLSSQSKCYEEIRNGTFKYFDTTKVQLFQVALEKTEEVIKVLIALIIKDGAFIRTERFKTAVCSFLNRPEVDYITFLNKIRNKTEAIRPCSNNFAYAEMFLNIYNWRNTNPIKISLDNLS